MLNRVVLIGRLTSDPGLRYTQNGKAVARFTLAVDRQYSDSSGEKKTDFIQIVTWGKQAENCANYLEKGRLVGVEGRLEINSWQGDDGQKKSRAEVVADQVSFLEWGDSNSPRR